MTDEIVVTLEIGKRVVRFRYRSYPEGGSSLVAVDERHDVPAGKAARVFAWDKRTGEIIRYTRNPSDAATSS